MSFIPFVARLLLLSSVLAQKKYGAHDSAAIQPKAVVQPFNTEFDWNLSKVLGKDYAHNVVISPISVKLALAALALGTTGSSAKELKDVLHFNVSDPNTQSIIRSVVDNLSTNQTDYELQAGTRLFVDSSVNVSDAYKNKLKYYLNAVTETVNFKNPDEAVQTINRWCKDVTRDRIQQLATTENTNDATMLLVNAIYFKGLWEKPFAKHNTKTGTFWNENVGTEVQMMFTQEKFGYADIPSLKSKIIRLPYVGNKFALYILLPDANDGLPFLMENINSTILTSAMQNLKEVNMRLKMPRFNLESTVILAPSLKKLGLHAIFSPGSDLNEIGNIIGGFLVVSDVVQKVGLDVNEQGSTFYAATEIELDTRIGKPSSVLNLKVDHPFVFIIADETMRTIISVGKITTPQYHESAFVPVPLNIPDDKGVANKFGVPYEEPMKSNRIDSFNNFDLKLLQKLYETNGKSNVFLSPASIKTALALLAEGAKGKSEQEILAALGLTESTKSMLRQYQVDMKASSNQIDFDTQNKVYLSSGEKLSAAYEQTVQTYYQSSVEKIDFTKAEAAVKTINDWVNKVTKGLIPILVEKDNFDAQTRLFIASSMYYKGRWLNLFPKERSKEGCFYDSNGACRKTTFMSVDRYFNYTNARELNSQILEIPFQDPRYSMMLFFPEDINKLLKQLRYDSLKNVIARLRQDEVNFSMPKFSLDYSSLLSDVLKMLGITDVFTSASNLSGILDNNRSGLTIKNVIHKAKIEVSEEGAQAAAVAASEIVLLSAPIQIELTVNKPFLFFIWDKRTSRILFEGIFQLPDSEPIDQFEASSSDISPELVYPNEAVIPESYPEYSAAAVPGVQHSVVETNESPYKFDLELLRRVGESNTNSNVFISPASVKSVLALVAEGARGKTEQELFTALGIPNLDNNLLRSRNTFKAIGSEFVKLDNQNKVFLSTTEKLSSTYEATIKQYYNGTVQQINFADPANAVQSVNNWVNQATRGLIPTLVDINSFDAATKLFLASCMYFKGSWLTKFPVENTKTSCFYIKENICTQTMFMYNHLTLMYGFSWELDVVVLDIPFRDEKYSMLIILPNKADGVPTLLKKLKPESMKSLLLLMEPERIHLKMPRFTVEYSQKLVNVLQQLNIVSLFGPRSNLSGITGATEPLSVKNIVHKAKIEVNEDGAKAAAATGSEIVLLSAPLNISISLDRPFLFFIRDKQSEGFLFEGIYMSSGESVQATPVTTSKPVTTYRPKQQRFTTYNYNRYTSYRPIYNG